MNSALRNRSGIADRADSMCSVAMYTLEHVLDTLKASRDFLMDRFHVRSLALFGSYSRNEQTEDSDIDVLVEVLRTDQRVSVRGDGR